MCDDWRGDLPNKNITKHLRMFLLQSLKKNRRSVCRTKPFLSLSATNSSRHSSSDCMRQSLTRGGGMGGQDLKQQCAVARATKGAHAMKSWLSSAVQSGIGSTGTGASSSVPSSLAPTEGCSPRCLSSSLAMSAPLPHSGAQQTDAASAASAGSVNHGSCLASHCPFESKAGGHRRVASSRCRPVRAKHKSELGREAPRACASDVRSP